MRGVLVAGHARCNLVCICYLVGQAYLETEVVEAFGTLVGHSRQFEVVRGDYAAHGQARYCVEEHARAVELVERVGALQNFVEDDERAAVAVAVGDELLQTQQLGVEIADAVGQVVAGAHAREQ